MRARVQTFVGDLRAAGVDVSVGETLDAMEAVGVVEVEREQLREALAAALVKDERDRAVFDDVFERHFPLGGADALGRRKRRRMKGATSEGGRGRRPVPAEEPSGGRPAAVPLGDEPGRVSHGTPERGHGRRRRLDALRRRPLRELTAGEVAELRELVAALADRLARRLARRWRRARRGPLDLRRTVRAASAAGGVPLALVRRRRRPVPPDLLALVDLSGSVAAASDLLLALLAPSHRYFRRVRLYAYVDRLCPIAFERGHVVPEGQLDLHGRSDLGRVLVELADVRPRPAPSTVVLVLGDARNNRRPPRADLVRALRARTRRLVWIVPEPRVRWNTGDSVLAAYARWCDAVHECIDLDGLVRAVRQAVA